MSLLYWYSTVDAGGRVGAVRDIVTPAWPTELGESATTLPPYCWMPPPATAVVAPTAAAAAYWYNCGYCAMLYPAAAALAGPYWK